MTSLTLLLSCAALAQPDPLAPMPAEQARLSDWLVSALTGAAAPPPPEPGVGIEVRRQDYDRLHKNESVRSTPLRLGHQPFARGLGTHSISDLVVRLPQAAVRLTAQVGVDNNWDTAGTRGSVTFAVEAGGRELWHSDVRRGSSEPLAVDVDLGGAREFHLRVGDAGDGPGWDQSDWAEAAVTLADGSRLWLDELPIVTAPARLLPGLPFGFTLDGRPAAELLAAWTRHVERDGRHLTVTWRDPRGGLQLTCAAELFEDQPAAEWRLTLTNTGATDSPLIEHWQPLTLAIETPGQGDLTLHHSHGSTCTETDWLPLADTLAAGREIRLAPAGGRSSNGTAPFFNVAWLGGGLLGAIGWSGQWQADFGRDGGHRLTVAAGQQAARFKLHPGEQAVTPSILLVAWDGDDWLRGQNLLRRTLLAHYVPRRDGQPALPPITHNGWFTFREGNDTTEANQKEMISLMAPLGVEDYWLDAGWFEGGWPAGAGSWTPKLEHFPQGLKPLGDAAAAAGLGFVTWFEPERVNPQSRIGREHPEFVLRAGGGDGLFNLGDDAARAWLTDFLSRCIADWGITIYRNDFNIDPLPFWQAADKAAGPDRVGLAEMRYVTGLWQMWDELRARRPGLLIDNCASGGRRIDLETIRRSFPLWRSDTQCCGHAEPIWDQVQSAGLSLWTPLHSAGVWDYDPYTWRSVSTTGCNLCADLRPAGVDKARVAAAIAETKALRPYWIGDHYPLTDINLDPHHWIAWQLDRPDWSSGIALFFRRPQCPYPVLQTALHLPRGGRYELTWPDTGGQTVVEAAELSHLRVEIPTAPGSALLRYRRLGP
jgi:alpha-galactosidase